MNTLIIECAGSDMVVALDSGQDVIFKRGGGVRNNGLIIPFIDGVLAQAGAEIKDIDAVACAVGPGSFTGIRIGIATAKAIADAVGCRLIAINTLQAAAYNITGDRFIVAEKCRNGEYYAAVFAGDAMNMLECKVMTQEQLDADEGEVVYFDGKSDVFDLAYTARRLARERGDNTLVPLYLKKSQAERMYDGD